MSLTMRRLRAYSGQSLAKVLAVRQAGRAWLAVPYITVPSPDTYCTIAVTVTVIVTVAVAVAVAVAIAVH